MRADSPGLTQLLGTLGSAQRGLLVVAELTTAEDAVAALAISKSLGWPVVADALSGEGEGNTPALGQTVQMGDISMADAATLLRSNPPSPPPLLHRNPCPDSWP